VTATYTGTDAISEARAAGVGPLEYMQQRGLRPGHLGRGRSALCIRGWSVTLYQGFDPTGPSLHVGHMLGMMMLATLQRFGHRPIALGGGGTALVGDPSGKTSARALVSEEDIRGNLEKILVQFDRHLDFEGGRFGITHPRSSSTMRTGCWSCATSHSCATSAAISP
jgi:tyrosyl-tRNA synthetase